MFQFHKKLSWRTCFPFFPDEYTTFVIIICFDCVIDGWNHIYVISTQFSAWDSLTTLLPYQISSDINNIYKQQQTKEVITLTSTESYFLKLRISEVLASHQTKLSELTKLQLLCLHKITSLVCCGLYMLFSNYTVTNSKLIRNNIIMSCNNKL